MRTTKIREKSLALPAGPGRGTGLAGAGPAAERNVFLSKEPSMHRLPPLSVFTLIGALSACMALTFAGSALAAGGDSFTGSPLVFEEVRAEELTKALEIPQKAANLTFYTDRATFEAAAPDLTKETFENGLVGPFSVVACSNPVSAAGSGGCFPAGSLQPGFSYAASNPSNAVVILGASAIGNPTIAIAADRFADSNIISFSNPDVFAVGFDVFGFGGPFTVSVFSASGLEGQTMVSPGGFFGVKSDTLITDIDIGASGGAEVVDNLCYGPGILDSDGDGVPDDDDVCDDTVIPEGVPTVRLGVNRFALTDDDGDFDTTSPPGGGGGPGLSFTIEDTAGCSCEQIIDAQGLGKGHRKFGCSISAMEDWVALVNP